ncbi:hypothetical protein PBI_SCTP2_222 [Salicola phage SCTP-2]|nr:hypothetical protein PBI_SCTP2_222 [Salicola phage SCTP-2]
MHIDQLIETLSNSTRQSPEMKFVIDYLEGQKSQGIGEMSDGKVLEVMNYVANLQEQTNIKRVNESSQEVSHHIAKLKDLSADDVLTGFIRTTRKTAISCLQQQIDSDQADGKSTEMKEVIKYDLELEEKISNLPSKAKQEMLSDYGHKLFDGFPYQDNQEK